MRHPLKGLRIALFWAFWPFNYFYRRTVDKARVLVICGDELVAVRDWITDGRWSLPGGRIKKGETPVAAARRELYEEVGLDIDAAQLRYLGVIYGSKSGYFPYFHAYALKIEKKTVPEKTTMGIVRRRMAADYQLG